MHELLADGDWHDRDHIIAGMVPLVPPAKAARAAERDRQRQAASTHRIKNHDRVVEVGARIIVRNAIKQAVADGTVERRTVEGRTEIRRTP